jgi:hypothetical protein
METLNNIEKIVLMASVFVVAFIHLSILSYKLKRRIMINHITKISFSVIILMSSFLVKGQDTICFKNKEVVAAKILEVGISEIKYQRSDNLTGPIYFSLKNDIVFIKYINGVVDSIKYSSASKLSMVNPYGNNLKIEKLEVVNNKFIYNGRSIGNRGLEILIDECVNQDKKILLTNEYKKMRLYRLNRSIYPPVIFASSLVILVATAPIVRSNQLGPDYTQDVWNVAGEGIIASALVRITGFVIDKVNKNKLNHKRCEIATLYNNFQ